MCLELLGWAWKCIAQRTHCQLIFMFDSIWPGTFVSRILLAPGICPHNYVQYVQRVIRMLCLELSSWPSNFPGWRLMPPTLRFPIVLNNLSFWYPGDAFGYPGAAFWWSWGPQGHPTGHLGDQTWILVDFWWILGAPWDQLWSHFDDFFVIWTTKLQCGF